MAISNASSNNRPGVCTSTTRPEAPFNGQVIYEVDTKQTLVWQGSAWVMLTDADQPPGLQLVKTQTITAGVSSVTVTDVFSATYSNYLVLVDNIDTSTAAGVTFRVGSATANYYWSGVVVFYGSSAVTGEAGNNAAQWATGIVSENAGVASSVINIFRPFLNTRTTYTAQGVDSRLTGAGCRPYSGLLNDTNSHTSITFLTTAGTMNGGTVRVYGYRN